MSADTVAKMADLIQAQSARVATARTAGDMHTIKLALGKMKNAMIEANRTGVREMLADELQRRGFGVTS